MWGFVVNNFDLQSELAQPMKYEAKAFVRFP